MVNWVIAIATAALVLATAALAWLTHLLVRETRKTREVQSEPEVLVTVEPSRFPPYFDLVIENIGRGTAYNVKITPPEGFTAKLGASVRDYTNMYSIQLLKPHSPLRTALGTFDEIRPTQQAWAVTYSAKDGRQFTTTCETNLSVYKPMIILDADPLRELAKSVKAIERSVRHFVPIIGRLGVNVFTAKDRAAEIREQQERRRRANEDQEEPRS